MPIYEYVCDACGKEFEELVGSSESQCPPCPKCQDGSTRRLMSASNTRTGAAPFGTPTAVPRPAAGGCGGGGGFS
jgi:putative FmdB family regulatory protein